MSFIDKSKPVVVTGGSGYIASWIIRFLLEEGFRVRTSLRDPNNPEKTKHLNELSEKHPGMLEIFEADLLDDNAFIEPLKDTELIIHTASPYKVLGVRDPKTELVDPALKGTRHVLRGANESSTVKRVVLTSSVAAIYGDVTDIRETENNIFTEKHWNTTSNLQHLPYSYSKTLAEKEAWKIKEEQDQWDLVVINPGFVMGPSLTKRTDSTSIDIIIRIASGKMKFGVPELSWGMADVRDAAGAHVAAGTNKEARGRHILVNRTISFLEIAQLIRENVDNKSDVPDHYLPRFLLYIFGPFQGYSWKFIRNNVGKTLKFDNSYSKQDLNVEYRPARETITGQIEQLKKDKLI